MTGLLVTAIWTLTIASWVSAAVLIVAARGQHIGALTERAIVACVLALFGTAYSLVVYNTEVHRILEMASVVVLVRVCVVVLLLVPCAWLALYLTGRLGDGQ